MVASLWQVNDLATAELMKRFHRGMLQQKLRPAALRAAQLEMSKVPRWKSPYYWAGLELQGEFRRRDEMIKRRLYERMGVGEYWIVDPEIEAIKVFRLNAGKYERTELTLEGGDVLTSSLFPGLQLPLTAVFEMP